jgi:MFS family permease
MCPFMMKSLRKRLEFMTGNMRILTVTQVLGMFFRRMVLPYVSLFILAVGGEPAQVGIINSLRPLAGLIIFPISGYLTDRTGRVKLIALANYLSALTMLLYVFAPSWEWIALGALLQGFMVFQFPPSSAILADSLDPRNRGVGIATMNTLANGVAMFSPYIAGVVLMLLGNSSGMRVLYGFMVLSSIVNGTLILRYLKETAEIEKTETKFNALTVLKEAYTGIPALLGNLPRSVKALGLVVGLGFVANGVSSPYWVVYVTDVVGLTNIEWGLILLFESIFKTVLTIPCGMLADRYGRSRTLSVAMVLSVFTLPSLILAKTFNHVLLIRLGAGLAGALFFPSSAALMADLVPRELRGRVMSAIGRGSVLIGATGGGTGGPGMGYLFTIPVMVASIVGGVLYSMNVSYPWICVLGTSIVQLLCVILFIRDPKKAE